MKKAHSNYQYQDMYVQHYICSNIRNQKDNRIHHTHGHNLSMEITIRWYQRKKQPKNWMKIIKNNSGILLEIILLCWIHIPYNINGTKNNGEGIDKDKNKDNKNDHSFFKLQRVTYRWSDTTKKKQNNSPDIFRCILHLRTICMTQSIWIFLPRKKIQHTSTRNDPIKLVSEYIIQLNEKCHGISQGSIIGRIIWKLPGSDIHADIPSGNRPLRTPNASVNGKYSAK